MGGQTPDDKAMSDASSVPKVVVVMPAYNAGRTLRLTYEELPKDAVNLVILVDDGSTDATLEVARQLGLEIFVHNRNYGYGANQKTCYAEALRAGADVVVMVHPDYQYDPRLVPQIIEPIVVGEADVVLGSRLKSGSVFAQEIIAQVVAAGFRIAEIGVPTRYFPEASSASFPASAAYGCRILAALFWFTLNQRGLRRSRRFDSLRARYTRLP